MKVLAFGEILWDVINGEEHLGGAPFNFAAHSAKCGNNSFIISRLGNDPRGINAFNRCKDYGVDNSMIQWDDKHPTGIVTVTLNNGQPDYTIHKGVAYDFIAVDDTVAKLPEREFDIFYFGSLIQRNQVSSSTLYHILKHSAFKQIFYDVNLRKEGYDLNTLHQSLLACTILKLNN
jgi:fructokinase